SLGFSYVLLRLNRRLQTESTAPGCSVLLPDRFPKVGTLMEVTLTTPRGDVSAKATVVWVDPLERLQTRHLTRHGVRFAQVSLGREHALDLVLDRISTVTAQEPQAE
ncbi:MAG: PilZ domain-containing protein, partial [Comamonadaceae bacterium]|nr:PilZ domain-containing protein [Comamonadaceae bacterium]